MMKKAILFFGILLMSVVSAFSANITEVWNEIKNTGIFQIEVCSPTTAEQNGFTTLTAGYINNPHYSVVESIEEMANQIDSSFLLGANSNGIISAKIYAEPMGNKYKVFLYTYSQMQQAHALVVFYGTCTERQLKALKAQIGKN